MVQRGERAPDFVLKAQDGRLISLSHLLENGPVVLYFYPRDFTTNCSTEARTFRDHHREFEATGTQVVGVSSDAPESHTSFCRDLRLPFLLLSDPGERVRQAYGAEPTLGLIPGRVTFVIDRDGLVTEVFSSQWRPKWHVSSALKAVRALADDKGAPPG